MYKLIGAAFLLLGAEQVTAQTLVGATTIRITHASGNDYLQLAEAIFTDSANTNVSPLATRSSFSVYPGPTSDYYGTQNLIDGVTNNSDDLYHSAGTSSNEFVQFTFATPQDLASLTLFGRVTLATGRNIYNVVIRDANGVSLFNQTLDAREASLTNSPVTVTFDRAVGAVPEPATWAMMLLGFGAIGTSLRRRKVMHSIEAT